MAPKKAGKKKDEVVDLPKASNLPDGQKSYFVGGWSSLPTLEGVSEIAEIIRPRKEEEEANAVASTVFVLPGPMGSAGGHYQCLVSHKMLIKGLLPSASAASAAAYEASRKRGGAEGDGAAAGGGDDAAPAEGDDAAAADGTAAPKEKQRKVILADTSVLIHSDVTFVGIKPTVTVAPQIVEVKAAAPAKGKKQTDEEKLKEAEEKKAREELAIKAAKEEEERLNKFAMPLRWAPVTVENCTFTGKVDVKQCHVAFKNCHFVRAHVEVGQYSKTSFTGCTFTQPAKNALYCFPLSDVTVKGCVFSGIGPAATATEAEALLAAANVPEKDQNHVGIHTDSAKLLVDDSYFEFLGTAVLLRGKFTDPNTEKAAAAPADGGAAAAVSASPKKAPNSQIVQSSLFDKVFGVGILTDKASGVLIQKNSVRSCGYYGARLVNGGKVSMLSNKFSSRVLVGLGTRPTLHGNTMDVPLVDENDQGNVYMEPTY